MSLLEPSRVSAAQIILFFVFLVLAIVLYLAHVNRGLTGASEEAKQLSVPWTAAEIRKTYNKVKASPLDVSKHLPPRQGRRYIVVGGNGLVGKWLVLHLLKRGEDPQAIRIIDVRQPEPLENGKSYGSVGKELLEAVNRVGFEQANIADASSVSHAFAVPWAPNVKQLPLSVFHTAATIRYFERAKDFLPLSMEVNVNGTKNVIAASKDAGATCLVATSSGSIASRAPRHWLAPWERWPKWYLQIRQDPDRYVTEDLYSNYVISKAEAERLVCEADDPESGFRTGCIRPGCSIYGTGGDATAGNYLKRGGGPTWINNIAQSLIYVENASIAHLAYEQCLTKASKTYGTTSIGGHSFVIADPNPPIRFGDMYLLLTTLSETPIRFVDTPPVIMFLLSYAIEWYAVLQHRYLSRIFPEPSGDLLVLQPALFAISSVHLVFDNPKAKNAPEDGGLNFRPPFNTMEALCKQLQDWNEMQRLQPSAPDSTRKDDFVADMRHAASVAVTPVVAKA